MDAHLGWFADPIYKGHYPESMVRRLGDRLPTFTDSEKELLKDSSMVRDANRMMLTVVLRSQYLHDEHDQGRRRAGDTWHGAEGL